jgi:hypothetical protein
MTISAMPATPRADASALLAFDGPAHVIVEWVDRVRSGNGDAAGGGYRCHRACLGCVSAERCVRTATIRVQHGA